MRISEPAADLAVAAALVSSLTGEPIPADMVVFGEIGLSGEVRAVSQTEGRLKEAAKLGFSAALTPKRRSRTDAGPLRVMEISDLHGLETFFGKGAAGQPRIAEV